MTHPSSKFLSVFWLAVAGLLLGSSLRIIGMTWGLPYQLQPDEPVLFISAWEVWDGVPPSLLPDYPRFYIYLLVIQREFITRVFGVDTPQVIYFFFGRWNAILISLLIMAVAYRAGKTFQGHWAGLAWLALMAVETVSVTDQGWVIKADSLSWLFALGVLWAATKAHQTRHWKWWLGAVFLTILAFFAKYTLAFVGLAPLFVLLDWRIKRPWLTFAMMTVGLILSLLGLRLLLIQTWQEHIEPRFVLCSGRSIELLTDDGTNVELALENPPCEPFWAFQRYAANFYQQDYLWTQRRTIAFNHLKTEILHVYPLWQLLLMGGLMGFSLWRADAKLRAVFAMLLAIWVCAAVIFVMIGAPHPVRQYYVLILILTGLTALSLGTLPSRSAFGIGLAILMLPQFLTDIDFRAELLKPDTRALTADWLLNHARRGEAVVVEYDSVEFQPQYGGFPEADGYFNLLRPKGLYELDIHRLFEQGIYYVVVDSRAQANPESYFANPERLSTADFERVLDLQGNHYFGPARQIYRTFRPDTVIEADLGGQIQLHGYDWELTPTGAELRLYWYVQQPSKTKLSVFIHVQDAEGQVIWQADAPPTRSTDQWEPFEWVFDERVLEWSLPAGDYTLLIGLYDPINGTRLPVNGEATGILELIHFHWAGS